MADPRSPMPPGWYHAHGDPPHTHRYWDGELWHGEPVPVPGARPGYSAHAVSRSYTGWGTRAAAMLIDTVLVIATVVVVAVSTTVLSAISELVGSLAGFVLGGGSVVGWMYLLFWAPGITGQSPGRRAMGYEIVSEFDGSYLGGAAFLGRQFLGLVINQFCWIDYIWPLWDDKNQRLADKAVHSIAIRTAPGPLFPLFPSGKPF